MDGSLDDLFPQDSGQLPSPSWQDQGLSGDLIPQEASQTFPPSWQWQTPFDDLIPQHQGDAAGPAQDDASTDDGSMASFDGTSDDAYDSNVSNGDPALLYQSAAERSIPEFNAGDGSTFLSEIKNIFSPAHSGPGMTVKGPEYVPSDAVHYCTGQIEFDAPPHADFEIVYLTGLANGMADLWAAHKAIAQFGDFDFQRDGATNVFYRCYTHASNYAVGVYMNAAGYTKEQMMLVGKMYALVKSNNAGSEEQEYWWRKGWDDANAGELATRLN